MKKRGTVIWGTGRIIDEGGFKWGGKEELKEQALLCLQKQHGIRRAGHR